MSIFRGLFNPYRLFWLILVALFCLGLWWALFIRPQNPLFTQITPDEVQRGELDANTPPSQSIDERAGPMSVDVSKANMTISSTDGNLKMRVWADRATKDAGIYTVKQGALEFVLKNHDTLLLKVSDAQFQVDSETARVSGTLIGHLLQNDQYFSAEELTWDVKTKVVVARRVRYIGPSVEVQGDQMSIDLETNQVDFEGPVKAGI